MERNRCVILGRNQEYEILLGSQLAPVAIKREPELYVSKAMNLMGRFGVEGHIRIQEAGSDQGWIVGQFDVF